MTKQFETKVVLLSGRNPGISRAFGDCIGAAYDASKHGVIGPVRAAAFKYAAAKYTTARLRINADHPAIIETAMEEDTVSLWLGSPGTSFVTGHAHPVDGGRLI